MIGYYVHHQGSGHLHRAVSINRAAAEPMTGLSTAARPSGWRGEWVQLCDDAGSPPWQDLTANGRLHYVPYENSGLRRRMCAISAWLERAGPEGLVVDVSVEVAVLARLHGIPVITVAQPGRRSDAAHRLGYDLSEAIIAPWPRAAGGMWEGTAEDLAKTQFVGAIGRFPPIVDPVVDPSPPGSRRVVVLNGTGGSGARPADLDAARAATPGWDWVHLDRAHGTWIDDPWPTLCSASVVVSHAGQNAIAEIAAARRPALLLPQERPFAEQQVMTEALTSLPEMPVLVRSSWPAAEEWPDLVVRLSDLDGTGWAGWNDGRGATRAAGVLARLMPSARAVSA